MSFTDNFFAIREKKKKKDEEEIAPKRDKLGNLSFNGAIAALDNADISPVDPTAIMLSDPSDIVVKDRDIKQNNRQLEAPTKSSWFEGGAFKDGYQFGDVLKSLTATGYDLGENVLAGMLSIGETTADAISSVAGGVAGAFGNKELQNRIRQTVEDDLINEEAVAKKIMHGMNIVNPAYYLTGGEKASDNSLFGEKADSLAQSAGQLIDTVALQAVGVPWWLTTGVTSFGANAESTLREDATYGEAMASSAISTAGELLTEKLFGGSGLGEKGLIKLEPLTKGITNKVVKSLVDFGINMGSEGFEETVSSVISNLGSALYREENMWDILTDENAVDGYITSFIGGMVLGGGMNVGKVTNSVKTGTDYHTGVTANEQKVIDAEIENRIAEEEADGKKLTSKQKKAIEEQVYRDLEKGYLSTDTIESVLGGNLYKSYKDSLDTDTKKKAELETEIAELVKTPESQFTIEQRERLTELRDRLNELENDTTTRDWKETLNAEISDKLRNTRLVESYNEQTRRGQTFEADISKYDAKQQAVIQKAIDSGILNNTNRTHDFVDMIAKISADKGVLFDFTDNAKLKESGFALDGKTVNGYVTKDGVTLNIDSHKSLNSVVGHEITHVLEGTEFYTELQNTLFEYAKARGEYDGRLANLTELYKNVKDADVNAELTADLVGDYLFADGDFITHLSTTNRNVFQKIYDEIKYLYKVATAGSKAARDLEKVKRAFDKAYRESVTAQSNTKYSLTQVDGIDYVKTDKSLFVKEDGTLASEREVFNSLVGKKIALSDGEIEIVKRLPGKDMYNELSKRYPKQLGNIENAKQLNSEVNYNMKELLENSEATTLNEPDKGNKHAKQGVTSFDTRTVKFYDGNKAYDIEFSIATLQNGKKIAYAKKYFGYDDELTKKIQTAESRSNQSPFNQRSAVDTIIPQNSEKSIENAKFSLSDSEGKQLSPAVQKRFGNSKVVDENGALKVVYHGTATGEFSIFDKSKGSVEGDFGSGFYFTDNEADVSEHYEGGGPDFDNKVGRRADEIWGEEPDIEYEEAERRAREELYKGSHKFEVYLNIENPAIVGETTLLDPEKYNEEYDHDDYDNDEDYEGDVEQLIIDDIDGILWDIQRNLDVDNTDRIANVLYDAIYNGGIDIEGLKKNINDLYLDNDKGELIGNEVTRQIIESLGYDGIIDPTVAGKWNMDIEDGTTHYIVFKPNQIKAITNQDPTDNPDIHRSLSAEGEAPKRYGNYNVYGKDIRLEKAPMQNNVAPIAPTKAEKANTMENSVADDFAPISEEEANSMASENLNSLTDADAPPEIDAPYYVPREAITIDNEGLQKITNDVNTILYLGAEDSARMAKTIQKFAQNENLTREELAEEIRRNYQAVDEMENTEAADELNRAKKFMRGTRIYVPAEIRTEFNGTRKDGYNAFRKEHMGHFFLTGDPTARGIDSLYKELSDAPENGGFPVLFPADIINPADQLKHMGEVAASKAETEIIAMPFDEDTIQEAVNAIYNGVAQYSQDDMLRGVSAERSATADYYGGISPVVGEAQTAQYEAVKPPKQSTEPRMRRADSKNNAPDGMEERSWVGTSTGSEAVGGIITPDDIPDDVRYYQVKSNKKTLETANARLARDGYAKSREYFEGRMSERKLSVEDIALGERLIQEAAKAGDAKAVRDLIIDVSILGTELGQRVQALSMINRLTPEGQLKALIRTVERGKAKGDKAFDGVEVTEDMTKQITDTIKEDGTFDQTELDEAVEDVKQQIADQMSVSAWDKITAWRYLSMLGNPKTHIRNIVSNVAMMGTRAVKNAVARTIEDIAPIKNRTKTWRQASDAVKAFAKTTTAEMEAVIKGDNKYSDEGSIKAKRNIFKSKIINAANTANTNAMEWEDAIFSKSAFRTTLQEYLTANSIKTEQDIKKNPELVAKAKEYALEESRKATFRQDSYLANKIGEVEQRNAFYGVAVGSVMPFKRTPINIAKTGAAYSPLGIARNIYDAVQVGKGNMDASEAIDHLAQTLTGTSLALIGYALASSGVLNGAGDDDKEGKYDYQLGKQSYSFNFGGDTYSLSWLSPIAMPLFVGANAYETLVEKNDWDIDVVIDTLGQTLDPMSEMSFLSSLDDVLSSYDSGMAKIWGAGETLVQNYATQFIPTLSSQIAATFDDTKRSTKASRDSGFTFGEETLNKIKYKIPVLRNSLAPTTDIWGNESKQTENVLARGFEAFLSPANKREGIATAVDEELKSLYSEVGKAEILPAIPYDYIDYGGEKYDMSSKDYTEYKQTYGQTAYELMESLFDTNTYKNATSEEKADMVADVYDYARDAAKKEYFTKQGVDFTNSTSEGVKVFKENPIKGAIAADLPVDEYVFKTEYPAKYSFFKANGITYKDYKDADEGGKRAYTWAYENPEMYTVSKSITNDLMEYRSLSGDLYDIKADKDASGKSISGSRKDKVAEYINDLDLDYGAKLILFKSEYNADDTYNYEIIDYLNGRADISYEDTVIILKELGFNVSADGYVTWD